VVSFVGAVLSCFGVHLWCATGPSVPTIFDTMTRSGEDALICASIDWVDKGFLLHRAGAALIVLVGISTLFWAVFFMRKGNQYGFAT